MESAGLHLPEEARTESTDLHLPEETRGGIDGFAPQKQHPGRVLKRPSGMFHVEQIALTRRFGSY